MWELGVRLLGEKSRPLIGRFVKSVGEDRVAEVLAFMAVHVQADPRSYFIGACKQTGKANPDDPRLEYEH